METSNNEGIVNEALNSSEPIDKKDNKIDETDPYAYLERGDFSSENFKIELSNLPRKFGIAQLKKKLIHLKVKPCKVKSIEQGRYAYVTFRNDEDKKEAIQILQGYIWKNKAVMVKEAAANADPLLLKRKLETDQENDSGPKRLKLADDEDLSSRLNDVVTPLWKMPYEKQLENKTKAIDVQLRRLTKEISINNKVEI